jgi:segregation and condensation protein A
MVTAANEDYKIKLEVFEGPLDLLLYLIKKEEVDIYNIPIERITTQYIEYLNLMRMLDLNIAGEFLVMAATLLMIKSRMLLPPEDRPDMETEEDDPRWDLVRQLIEYKKFKDAAAHLQTREYLQANIFERGVEPLAPVEPETGLGLSDVNLFDLISALNEALKRFKVEEFGEIYADQFTIADKIEAVLATLQTHGRVGFSQLFSAMASRHEIVCTFLALLELIRLRHISAIQEREFGEIIMVRAEETVPLPPAVAPAADQPGPDSG